MALDFRRALLADQYGQKAIPAHPALMSNDPVSVYQPGANRQEARLRDHKSKKHGQVYGGALAMDTLMECVDFYGQAVSTASWRLEAKDGSRLVQAKRDDDPKDFKVGPADLYELLRKPNPYMLYDELIELMIIDLLLVGNAYWVKIGMDPETLRPAALYRMAPEFVEIKPGQLGPAKYLYKPPGTRKAIEFDPWEVVHFKLPNPHDAFFGLGVVQKGSRALDLDINVTDTMASYYANRADPSVIVQSERRVPRDVFKKLQAQLRQKMSGPANAGQLLVLESGLKATTLSPSAADALFEQISGLSQGRVYRMFRLSKLLFGDVSDAGAAQVIPAVRRETDNYVIKPFAEKLALRVSEYLASSWDVNFLIDYNYSLSPEEQMKAIEAAAAVPGIKVRELRRALKAIGLVDSESTGDSEIDEEILNMPMPEMDANGQGGAADRPLGSEPGRPPLGKNTKVFPKTRSPQKKSVGIDDVMQRMAILEDRARIKRAAEGKAVMSDGANVSIGRKLDAESRPGDPSSAARKRAIDAAAAGLQRELGDAATTLERALLDHAEGKSFKRGDLRNRISKSEAWATFRDLVAAALEKYGRHAASAAALDSGIEADLDYDEVTRRVIYRKDGVGGIVKTLKKRLLGKLANDLDDASTQKDAESLIQAYLADWRSGQAAVIADTEATHVYNEAMLDSFEATGATEVYVEDGDDHDAPCQEANGSVWSIDHARENRLEHPNCRRAFLPVPEVA